MIRKSAGVTRLPSGFDVAGTDTGAGGGASAVVAASAAVVGRTRVSVGMTVGAGDSGRVDGKGDGCGVGSLDSAVVVGDGDGDGIS